jgi:phage-related protein
MTTLKIGVTELLNEFLKLVGDVDMEAFNAKIQEGFGVLKDEVLPAVKEGLGWIIDNKDILIAGLASIASGFVAFKIAGVITALTSAFKLFFANLAVGKPIMDALNLSFKLSPIGLITTAIGLLVGAFIYLWNTCEPFKEFWVNLWDDIKNVVSIGIKKVTDFFKGLIEWVKSNWQSLLLIFINPFAGLFKYFYDNNTKFKEFVDNAIMYIKELPTKVWTWLLNTIAKINQWRIDLGQKAREAGQELLNKLIEKIKEIPDKVKSVGADIVAGLWNGISDKFGWLTDKIKGFASNVTDKLKDFFGIHSPSKVMADEVGKWLPEGIAVGISKNAKSVLGAMRDLTMDTVGSARAGLSTATTLGGGSVGGGVVNNFTQVINSPKQLSRLDIYRQSKNLLGYAGGGF